MVILVNVVTIIGFRTGFGVFFRGSLERTIINYYTFILITVTVLVNSSLPKNGPKRPLDSVTFWPHMVVFVLKTFAV